MFMLPPELLHLDRHSRLSLEAARISLVKLAKEAGHGHSPSGTIGSPARAARSAAAATANSQALGQAALPARAHPTARSTGQVATREPRRGRRGASRSAL